MNHNLLKNVKYCEKPTREHNVLTFKFVNR